LKYLCRGCKIKVLDRPGWCVTCEAKQQRIADKDRGSAHQRGYTSRWREYSKWYLSQADNQLCKIKLPGCSIIADCVDHVKPVDKDDPRFWIESNHQAACRHCNSVKGRRELDTQGGIKSLQRKA
jgi:5-methylcytosine-specific restriction protein A